MEPNHELRLKVLEMFEGDRSPSEELQVAGIWKYTTRQQRTAALFEIGSQIENRFGSACLIEQFEILELPPTEEEPGYLAWKGEGCPI